MRLDSGIWFAIFILGLFTIGSAVTPYHVAASNSPQKETIPTLTHATLPDKGITSSKVAFQASYLSLSLRTDKPVYLTGETVNISVSTNVGNTHVRLLAQLPGGSQETIGNFTTSGTYTLLWPAPATSGLVRFTCEGEATVEVWDTCSRYVCEGEDCWWEDYPCLRSVPVTGNAFADIRVFSRTTSISGHVIDSNQHPIPGATVYVASTTQSTTTNNDGSYEFTSYQLGNNYTLVNQIPTVTETVSVEAIACEPQSGKSVPIQAESGATNIDFTLNRSFYPPAIDLSEFTFDAFPGWPEAKEYATWQNILGITIDGPVEPKKLLYGTKEISPPLFNIGTKKLYLITKPELGRYFLELQGTQNTEYTVAAAATLNNLYFEPLTASGNFEGQKSQRLRVMLRSDGMELKVIKPPSLLLIIVPIVVGLIGGLVAAYFLTGGKFRVFKKAPAAHKAPKAKETTKGKTRRKSTVKKTKKQRKS